MKKLVCVLGLVALGVSGAIVAQDNDGAFEGRLGADSPRDGRPFATRTLTLRAGQRYAIAADSEDFDPLLELYPVDAEVNSEDEGDAVLVRDDDGGDGNNAALEFTPDKSGQYKLRVISAGEGLGRYTLKVRQLPALPPPTRPAQTGGSTLTLKNYSGTLSSDDPEVQNKRVDDYLIHLEGGKTALIFVDSESDNLDPVATLYANAARLGDPLESDDDSGKGANSLITYVPEESGDYVLRVSSIGDQSRGNYKIRIAQ